MSQGHCIKKRKENEHLTYEDRQRLEMYIRENRLLPKRKKRSKRRIAMLLGTSPATICRELRRGEVDLLGYDLEPYISYSADVAQADYRAKGSGKGRALKIGNDHAFARYVEEKVLRHKYSPDAIIMELRRDGNPFRTSICTRTMYSYIGKGVFLGLEKSSLRRAGRCRERDYEQVRRSHRGDGKSITERPDGSNGREESGHWEMDCIESGKGKGKSCLLTMVERRTRDAVIMKLSAQTQAAVVKALDQLERRLGKAGFSARFISITSDNGSEFMDWRSVERSCLGEGNRTSHYFAHPTCSWERGSNENINGIIRWFIPKGSAISCYSAKQIQWIEDWINNLPRRILGGMSAKIASARAEAA